MSIENEGLVNPENVEAPVESEVPANLTPPSQDPTLEVDPIAERLKETRGEEDNTASEPAPPNLNDLDLESLGDEFITAQVGLLKSYHPNLDLDKALGKALEFGDKGLIDVYYIQQQAGEQASQVVRHLESLYDHAEKRTQELGREIVELAGGEARWQSAVNAFNTKAGEGTKRIVRELLSSYNQRDYLEAAQVILNFAGTEGAVNQPAQIHTPQASPQGGVDQPLTKSEYVAEIAKAQQIKDRRERQRVETELASRRAASRRAGIN